MIRSKIMVDKDIRIVYMGTPDFAVESLKALVEGGYNVVGVVTGPDKRSGRGQKITATAVKLYAESQGLTILQPDKFRDETFLQDLRDLKADLQIVVAFKMLPEVVWSMPPMGTFNLHGSLLPKYRGAAPLNWAIMNGDKETGITTFLLKKEIDTGKILLSEKIEIGENDTVGDIHDALMVMGGSLVCKTVTALADGTVEPKDQIEESGEISHAPKIFKADCEIDWSFDTAKIHNKIRGLSPYPAAWSSIETSSGDLVAVKIFKSLVVKDMEKPAELNVGDTISDGKSYIYVCCKDGLLSIEEFQLAGKKRVDAKSFLLGNPIFKNFK